MAKLSVEKVLLLSSFSLFFSLHNGFSFFGCQRLSPTPFLSWTRNAKCINSNVGRIQISSPYAIAASLWYAPCTVHSAKTHLRSTQQCGEKGHCGLLDRGSWCVFLSGLRHEPRGSVWQKHACTAEAISPPSVTSDALNSPSVECEDEAPVLPGIVPQHPALGAGREQVAEVKEPPQSTPQSVFSYQLVSMLGCLHHTDVPGTRCHLHLCKRQLCATHMH